MRTSHRPLRRQSLGASAAADGRTGAAVRVLGGLRRRRAHRCRGVRVADGRPVAVGLVFTRIDAYAAKPPSGLRPPAKPDHIVIPNTSCAGSRGTLRNMALDTHAAVKTLNPTLAPTRRSRWPWFVAAVRFLGLKAPAAVTGTGDEPGITEDERRRRMAAAGWRPHVPPAGSQRCRECGKPILVPVPGSDYRQWQKWGRCPQCWAGNSTLTGWTTTADDEARVAAADAARRRTA